MTDTYNPFRDATLNAQRCTCGNPRGLHDVGDPSRDRRNGACNARGGCRCMAFVPDEAEAVARELEQYAGAEPYLDALNKGEPAASVYQAWQFDQAQKDAR